MYIVLYQGRIVLYFILLFCILLYILFFIVSFYKSERTLKMTNIKQFQGLHKALVKRSNISHNISPSIMLGEMLDRLTTLLGHPTCKFPCWTKLEWDQNCWLPTSNNSIVLKF